MKRSTVLFATDFSEASRRVLEYAAAQARGMDAALRVVHVRELPAHSGEAMLHAGIPVESAEQLESRLREIVPPDFDGPCEHILLEGDAAREIVRFAEREGVELIVIGSHGRTGLMRVLMGSVAEQVVRRAPCPVLVVKQPGRTDS